ncbi:MAG: DHA2 family efflux MFS transporter permease subunit [Alphaproteobacteria bacterium]
MSSVSLKQWMTLLGMSVLVVLVNLDYSAVNVALVEISEHMDSDLNTLQWLLSGYVLAWAALVIPGGKLADRYGNRLFLLLGTWTFMIASLICGMAQSIEVLIFGRLVQGLAGALFLPPLYAITFKAFPKEQQGFAIGVLGVGCGLGLALGPTFGGAIIEYINWRWIFYLMIPFSVLGIITGMTCIEKDQPETEGRIDGLGAGLLCVAMAALMYAFNQIEVWGLTDSRLLTIAGGGAFALIAFLVRSNVIEHPLLPKVLFENPTFLASNLAVFLLCYNFSSVLVGMGLYMQNVLGYDSYKAGYVFLAMTVTFGVLSPVGGKLVDKFGGKYVVVAGFALMAGCAVVASMFTADVEFTLLILSLFLFGLGLGVLMPSVNAVMLQSANQDALSTASGMFTMMATLGNTTGVVSCTSIIVGYGQGVMRDMLASDATLQASGDTLMALSASAHRNAELLAQLPDATSGLLLLNTIFTQGFNVMMMGVAISAVLGLLISWRFIRSA